MQGRAYTISVENVSITNAGGDADLLEINPASNKPIELYGIQIFSLSEVQEAEEEWLRCGVYRGNTTTGNGTAATPRPIEVNGAAASMTAKTYGTTPASGGTALLLMPFGVQVRAGYEIILPEGDGFTSVNGTYLCVRLLAGPADDLTADLCFHVREYC